MKLLAVMIAISVLASAIVLLPTRASAGLDRELVFPYNDALVRPHHATTDPTFMAGAPPAPGYDDLSEYLMGTVAVGVVLPESNGAIDADSEDWDAARQAEVSQKIETGLNWWTQQDLRAELSFTFEYHMSVPIGYEPITHTGPFDEGLWISDVMTAMGYTTGAYDSKVVAWANSLRSSYRTDWAFAVFVVDSLNDADGSFTSGYSAYAYLGGPFFIMTYDNDGYGIGGMDYVAAHEMAHIFYATDEYNGWTENSGYLNVADIESSGCIMHRALSWCISAGTIGQLGWRDSDGDGVFDILDEPPATYLSPYAPDPTNDTTPVYTGTARVVPLKNLNPYGPGNDVTISKITRAQFAIDISPWYIAQPIDGSYGGEMEGYLFSTSPLASGVYTFFARAMNTEGNTDLNPPSDVLTIDADKPSSALEPFPAVVNVSLFMLVANASDNLGLQTVELYYSYEGGSPQSHSIDATEPWEWDIDTSSMNGDGNYSFYSVAVDWAGNREDAPAVADVSVLVDTVKPDSTLEPLSPYINQTSFSLKARAVDAGGISSVEIWMEYESAGLQMLATMTPPPWTYQVDVASSGDGHYAFYTRATDNAGNVELQHQVADATTVVDTTPPVATLVALPQYTNSTRFDIFATASDLNGLSSVELWYRRNGGSWNLFSSIPAAPWRWNFDAAPAGEGMYEFVTMAVDNAGNREVWPAVNETATLVDASPPTVVFTMPAPGIWINVSHLTVEWDGFDALSGIKEYRLHVGSNAWILPGPTEIRDVDFLPDGFWTAELTAWDKAGNRIFIQMTIKVDATPPLLQFASPSQGGNVESPITVIWEGTDATSGIGSYEYSLDGGMFTAYGMRSNVTLELGPGDHTIVVRAYDVAGNVREETIAFTVVDRSISGLLTVSLIAVAAIAAVLTAIILVLLKRRKKREGNNPLPPPPPPAR